MKVVIGYQESVLSEGLCCLLEANDIEVIHEGDDLDEVRRLAAEVRPDVVILGTSFRAEEWIDVVEELAGGPDPLPVLLVSRTPAGDPLGRGLDAGARGAVAATVSGDEFERAVRSVAQGVSYLCADCTQRVTVNDLSAQGTLERLSEREREVLALLADGHGAKEIAYRLGVSSKTIDTHRQNISRKLQAESLADLVKHAIQAGLTSARPS
jgi:DNA-binding NarL/FixJ family response regulator